MSRALAVVSVAAFVAMGMSGCLGKVAEAAPIDVEITLVRKTPVVEGMVLATTRGEGLGGASVTVTVAHTDSGTGGPPTGGSTDGDGVFWFAFGAQTGAPAPGGHILQAMVILGPVVGGDTLRYEVP